MEVTAGKVVQSQDRSYTRNRNPATVVTDLTYLILVGPLEQMKSINTVVQEIRGKFSRMAELHATFKDLDDIAPMGVRREYSALLTEIIGICVPIRGAVGQWRSHYGLRHRRRL